MSTGAVVSVVGDLHTMKLDQTTGGTAVVTFVVACTPESKFDRLERRLVMGTPVYIRCELWGPDAETAAATLFTGARVVVFGDVGPSGTVRVSELGTSVARGWSGGAQ